MRQEGFLEGWGRGVVRMPSLYGPDLLAAVAEALARVSPLALEVRRTDQGVLWSILAPRSDLALILERLRVASGGRILPGEIVEEPPADAGAFFAPVPPIPFLPPASPTDRPREAGAGAGRLAALAAGAPGAGWRIYLWGPHPDAPRLTRLAGPAFSARLPEASGWELWWKLSWGMTAGGVLLAGIGLNLLFSFPESLAYLPPALAFAMSAFGLVAGTVGIQGLIRFWAWRHLPREALAEKLRTALMEASLEILGDPSLAPQLLPGAWAWRKAREIHRFPLAVHEAVGLWLPPAGFPVEQTADPRGRADMPALGGIWTGEGEELPVGRTPEGRPVRIPWPQLPVVVLGGTGSGKSSFLLNMAEAVIRRGEEAPGMLALDPHGPLARAILRRLAREVRRNPDLAARLVVVDPTWEYAIALNLFCAPEMHWAISTLITAGRQIWEGYWGPRMSGVLEATAHLLWAYNQQAPEEQRLSFRHVPFVLFNAQLRREELMRVIPAADLPQAVLLDLQMGQAVEIGRSPLGWQVEVASPIVSKVLALHHPWIRAALAAPRMADMARWIRERRWVIVSLPSGILGEGHAALIAAWFYNLWEWSLRAAGSMAPQPTLILMDEVHRIAAGLALPQTLAEIRKYGGVPVMANQSLAVLREREETRGLPSALLANAGTLAIFRPDPLDLPILEQTLGWGERTAGERLRPDLPAYHFYLRTLAGGRWTPPILVDARNAFPPLFAREGEGEEEEAEIAVLRELVRAAHPEDYIRIPDGIRQEQINAMRLMTPDIRAALERLDLEEAGPEPGARPGLSIREQLGL